WLIAATLGFLSVGYFYHHYALPLLVPLSLATAPLLARARLGPLGFAAICLPPAFLAIVAERQRLAEDRAQIEAIVAAIPVEVRTGCMLVYEGPPILYHLARACAVTPYLFPDHLYSAREGPAIGRDQHAALTEALA